MFMVFLSRMVSARTQASGSRLYSRETLTLLRSFITPAFARRVGQPLLDELLKICPADFPKPPYADAGEGSCSQEAVSVSAAQAEVLAHLVGAHQVFG